MTLVPATEEQIRNLFTKGHLAMFKSDGPSDFGLHKVITFFGKVTRTRWSDWSDTVEPAAYEHDQDFYLGELSGKLFEESNNEFEGKLIRFPKLAKVYYRAVTKGGVADTGLPWQWRFGWLNQEECWKIVKEQNPGISDLLAPSKLRTPRRYQ